MAIMRVIPVLGPVNERTLEPADGASFATLGPLIRRYFDESIEHVAVLYEGQRRDMFVGETSAINGRHLVNARATEIYRANWLTQHPETDPTTLPAIHGPAVLFPDLIVWR